MGSVTAVTLEQLLEFQDLMERCMKILGTDLPHDFHHLKSKKIRKMRLMCWDIYAAIKMFFIVTDRCERCKRNLYASVIGAVKRYHKFL